MLEHYFKDISKIPLLTRIEEIELAKRIKGGDKKAREKMIVSNLRLVISVAKKYRSNTTLSLEDLIQEGTIGLIKGIEKFDETQGFKLSTYVVWWIRQSISRAVADKSRTIRRPIYASLLKNKILNTKKKIEFETGKHATIAQICEELDITQNKYNKIMTMPNNPTSLDRQINDENSKTISDVIADEKIILADQLLIHEDVSKVVQEAINKLTPREENILRMRFGLSMLNNEDKFELTDKKLEEIKNL